MCFSLASSRRTFLIQLDSLGNPALEYAPGDHLVIYPENRHEVVDSVLKRVKKKGIKNDTLGIVEVLIQGRSNNPLLLLSSTFSSTSSNSSSTPSSS